MLTSLTYLIVALALASSILVSAVPLAPITIEPYPSRREPVGALQENTDDISEVMNPFEVHTASQTAEGDLPKYEYAICKVLLTYSSVARWTSARA
jgi:hypothetical protein